MVLSGEETAAADTGPIAAQPDPAAEGQPATSAEGQPATSAGRPGRVRRRGPGVAGIRVPWIVVAAHVALLVAAIGYWGYLDRHLWFYGDEWDFLDRRGVFHPAVSIWTPHNEHWSTLPILLWRAIYNVVHLSSYWPYLVPLFLANLLIVHLVWRRMLRDGVPPWLATALAGLLGLLGSGWEDLGWAFQIGFLGSVLFGLLALDMADRRDASLRWDILTALVSLAAFMCSTGGDSMCLGLFVVLVIKRPWRQTVRVLALPAVAYVAWFELAGKKAIGDDNIRLHTFLGLPEFIWAQTVEALGSRNVLLGALVASLLAIWIVRHARRLLLQHPAAVGLLLAAIAFYALAGLGRDRFGDVTPSRYTYIGVALILPLIGMALGEQVRRRWRWPVIRPVAVVAVLGIVISFTYGNLRLGHHAMAGRVAYIQKQHRLILNAAQLIADGHQYILSYRFPESSLNAKYALRLWKLHQIPHVGPLDKTDQLYFETRLDVALTLTDLSKGKFQVAGHYGNTMSSAARGCETFTPDDPAALPAVPPAILLRMAGAEKTASAMVRTPGRLNVYVGLRSPGSRRRNRPPALLTRAAVKRVASAGQLMNTGALVTGKVQTDLLAPSTSAPKVPGVSYLYDIQPGANLVITFPPQVPVQLCDLARPTGQ